MSSCRPNFHFRSHVKGLLYLTKCELVPFYFTGLNVTENFTVNVQDVNDQPSNILFNGALEIQENSNAGVLVAIASAVDEDFYQVHRYAIQSIVGFGQQSTR